MTSPQLLIEDAEISIVRERQEYNLVALLKPRIFIDGNQWCVLRGENIQDGVAGFGDTAYLAALDFNRAWHAPAQRSSVAPPALSPMEAADG